MQIPVVGKVQSLVGFSCSSQSVLYMIHKPLHYLAVHCLSKCKLGPVATLLLIVLFHAINYAYFVGSFNGPSRSAV